MTDVTALIWPHADATGGTPQEIAALLREIGLAAGVTLTPATLDQQTHDAPIDGPSLTLYLPFLRGSILAYDAAVTGGHPDSAAAFEAFTSAYFSDYVAFRNRWTAPQSNSARVQLHLADIETDPTGALTSTLESLAPQKFTGAAASDQTLRQIAATAVPLLDRLRPEGFRHNDPTLIAALRAIKLPRDVVLDTFEKTMKRPLPEEQVLSFQSVRSIGAFEAALMASAEYLSRFGMADETIVSGYKVLLNRGPSVTELDNTKKTHRNLQSLRKNILKSVEFSNEYAALLRDGNNSRLKSVNTPTPFKSPPRLNAASVDRVVFLHIPKCGGTTLHNMLTNWFGPENVHPERFNGLYGYSAASLASARVFSGHYDHYATTLIPGPKKMITFLRDPLDRLVSLYNFHRAHTQEIIERDNLLLPRWANEHDIDAYFAQPHIRQELAIDNSMVRNFSDVPQIPLSPDSPALDSSTLDDMLAQAKRNIEKFAFVGFMDNYENDLDRLAHMLGRETPETIEKAQVLDDLMQSSSDLRKISKQRPNPQSLEAMEDLVAYDRVLYEHARALFT